MVDYIKLQEIQELRQALKIKDLSTNLLQETEFLILYLLDYAQKYSIRPPNMDNINRLLEKAQSYYDSINSELIQPTVFDNSKNRRQLDSTSFEASYVIDK